jgi:poly(3-hydroxybutyrate) depolymerase
LAGSGIDDVEFTHEMIGFMQSNWNVDSSRIFTSGFSNGAFMSEVLLCQASQWFVAAASISGIVEMEPGNGGGLDACDKAYSGQNKYGTDSRSCTVPGSPIPVV